MTRRMRGCLALSWSLVVLGCLVSTPIEAQTMALKVGRVVTAAASGAFEIENATVLVVDGRIQAVGRDVVVPPGVEIHSYPDAVLVPGFIAADTTLGSQHRGDEAVAAGYMAVDGFDRYADFRRVLASGVTTVHLDPGAHRLLTGQGAVVSLAGAPEERVLVPNADLTVNLGVYNPPADLDFSFPASSDAAIEMPTLQRPSSRLGQFLGLTEKLAAAQRPSEEYSHHLVALAYAWQRGLPLRIEADRGADLLGAASFLAENERQGYLVGGAEAHEVAATLSRQKLPVVYRPRRRFSSATQDIGASDGALDSEYRHLNALKGRVALAPPHGESVARLRLAAVAAHGAGFDRRRAIEAITRVPAEILGVSDEVGSITAGRRADMVLLTGDPLAVACHTMRVYVGGKVEYDAPTSGATIVRAGTIWVSPDRQISDGEMLVQDGRVVAVGRSVPHPRGARVIHAGDDAFVAPGFIDARGHLGLEGDRSSATPDVDLTSNVGVPDVTDARVLASGVTTVMVTPYAASARGARIAAIKTGGDSRDARVIEPIASVSLSVRGQDPAGIRSNLSRSIDRAKKYVAAWKKYEKELAEYLEKKERGEVEEKKVVEEEVVEGGDAVDDPVSGVWEGTVSGGPMPEPQTGKISLRLKGDQVEGRVIEPQVPVEHRIVLTLSGKQLSGVIEVETDGMGYPQVEAELVGDDEMQGTIALMGIEVNFTAKRVDKEAVEFKVEKRTRIKSGRPDPPKVDPGLEPYRLLLEKKIPLVVDAETPAEVREVVKTIVDGYKMELILLNGGAGADVHGELLAEKKVSVVLPRDVLRSRRGQLYHLGEVLTRHGLAVGFQSDAEDGARDLPLVALYAVEQGMSPDEALAALTTNVAKMYKLDDRVGSLEPGRDADFVIFEGHPFRRGAAVRRVFVGGEEATR